MKKFFQKLVAKWNRPQPSREKRLSFQLETLEPRVMLSADPVIEEFFSNEVMAVEVASVWLR